MPTCFLFSVNIHVDTPLTADWLQASFGTPFSNPANPNINFHHVLKVTFLCINAYRRSPSKTLDVQIYRKTLHSFND